MSRPAAEAAAAAATRLRALERPVRVLSALTWPSSVRERFFADGGRELPMVEPVAFDGREVRDGLREVRRTLDPQHSVHAWLLRTADAIATASAMLESAGTPEFLRHSVALYGEPTTPLLDRESTSLELAEEFDALCDDLSALDLGAPPAACHAAEALAARLRGACEAMFGSDGPVVEIVDELSANALASPERVRIRRGACFSDRDLVQLVEHEIHVHVATSRNGQEQDRLPILAASHPGTTRTQEGLAVFAEMVTGAMDPDRFRRLGDRVRAIQSAIEGADFLDVYRMYLERTEGLREQAFESARRVFRGGVLTGGAPFTKDVVYLDGLLRVTDFLRTVVSGGRLDLLMLLFVGKLDLEDLPALARAASDGLVRAPRFLPPWVEDRRFLVSFLVYQRFLGGVDVRRGHAHYEALLAGTPRLALRAWN